MKRLTFIEALGPSYPGVDCSRMCRLVADLRKRLALAERQIRALLVMANAVGRAKRYAWLDREALEQAMERAFAAHDRLKRVSKEGM